MAAADRRGARTSARHNDPLEKVKAKERAESNCSGERDRELIRFRQSARLDSLSDGIWPPNAPGDYVRLRTWAFPFHSMPKWS